MDNAKKTEIFSNIQWQPLIEMIIVLVTIIGSTVPLYLHTDNKLSAALQGIQSEMHDFHGKLERQDAEYKAHLLYLHEK